MESTKIKTLGDLPKLTVRAMHTSPSSDSELNQFELLVNFDPILEQHFAQMIEGNGVQWFWLLIGERDCLTATLKSFDKYATTATLVCEEKKEPKLEGATLAYLSSYWQAFHVWMVLDPNWGWKKRQFEGVDAVAEDYEAKDVSFIDGRAIKVWTKLEPREPGSGQSRYYPADDQLAPVRTGARLIPGGWGHEHCELCNRHIDAGMIGFCDPAERWMCEDCYQRYVTKRNLAFIDEL